jgi:prepilin-type N-terminal cleavage/methylation domain-containing protein
MQTHSIERATMRTRNCSAFTLIELLVVIAIIAILAAILTPAARRALESGKSAHCVASLRQMGPAMYMYSKDHDGQLPPYATIGSDRRGERIDGVRYRDFRKLWLHTEWFRSGAYPGAVRDGDGYLGPYLSTEEGHRGNIMGCVAQPTGEELRTWNGVASISYVEQKRSYGLNWQTMTDPNTGGGPRHLEAFDDPARTVFMVDGSGLSAYVIHPSPGAYGDFTRHQPLTRHLDRFNAAFVEGHVESGTPEELYVREYFLFN